MHHSRRRQGRRGVAAAIELLKGYMDMRLADVRGADKWFHCVHMCKAARHSQGITMLIALVREGTDLMIWSLKDYLGMTDMSNDNFTKQLMDSLDDMSANLQGIECDKNTSCEECCCIYKVNGL
jgi:hypothetical protein